MIGPILPAIVLTLAAVSPATTGDEVVVDRTLVERAAAAAERALPKGRRLRCEVTTEWHRAPDGAEHIDPKVPPYTTGSHIVSMWGDRTVCERVVSLNAGYSYAKAFDDGYLYNIALAENDCSVQKHDLFDVDTFGLPLLLQIDVPSAIGGQGSVAETIRRGTAVAVEETGTHISIRLIPPGAQEALDKATDERKAPRMKAWVYGVTMDTADPPRLVEAWTELPALKSRLPDGTERDTPARNDRWTVVEWQGVGDETIARVLRRTTSDPSDGREIVEVARVVEVEAIPMHVPPPPILADGFQVRATKDKLLFVVGSRDITYQGRTLRLKEPLRKHPGAKLEELIATAEAR